MADQGSRFADEEWLLPDQPGRSLAEIIRQHGRLFARAMAVAFVIGLLIAGATAPSRPSAPVIFGPPPTDRQLLWFGVDEPPDPRALHLQAFDWTGQQVGRVSIPCRGPCAFSASPDGQRLLVYEVPLVGGPSIPGTLYDVRGRVISSVAEPLAAWADDSRHLCRLRRATEKSAPPFIDPVSLEIVDADTGHRRLVASIAGTNALTDLGSWELLACSEGTERAVVAFSGQHGMHDLFVLQLTTGETIYERHDVLPGAICGCPVENVVAAPSARLVVENLVGGSIEMIDLSNGVSARRSAIQGPALGLSWDGGRALTSAGIVEIATGDLSWRAPSPLVPSLTAARPRSNELLVFLSHPNGVGDMQVIVRSDGLEVPLVLSQR